MMRKFDIRNRGESPVEFFYRQKCGRSTQDYIGDFIEPWRLCYNPYVEKQRPDSTLPYYVNWYFMPDIVVDKWWYMRCRVRCCNGVLTDVHSYLIPNEDVWPQEMIEKFNDMLTTRYGRKTNQWGIVEMSFEQGSTLHNTQASLRLQLFFNYGTAYFGKSEMEEFYPDRWKGVMRRVLCMTVQAFVNVQQVHSRVKVSLYALPTYRSFMITPSDPNTGTPVVYNTVTPAQTLGQFYNMTFGFVPINGGPALIHTSGGMQTQVETILNKCQDVFKSMKRLAPRKTRRMKKVPYRWQPTRVARTAVSTH